MFFRKCTIRFPSNHICLSLVIFRWFQDIHLLYFGVWNYLAQICNISCWRTPILPIHLRHNPLIAILYLYLYFNSASFISLTSILILNFKASILDLYPLLFCLNVNPNPFSSTIYTFHFFLISLILILLVFYLSFFILNILHTFF